MKKLTLFMLCFILSGCGTVNNLLVEKSKTVEQYHIFDIKTTKSRNAIIKAASDGLGRNVNDASESRPIPSGHIPSKPGRFKLEEPLKGSQLSALAALGGNSFAFKVATCDGAVWTANATRNVSGSHNLKITACLYQYKAGYHLNLYATFNKKQGGYKEVARKLVSKVVGSPEAWVKKTFLDIVKQIESETGASYTYLEGYPELQ